MIKYIKTINQERRQLQKGYRTLTDVLGVIGVGFAYILLTSVYKQCFWQEACNFLQNNVLLFWAVFPFAFLLSVSIAQVLVLGICSLYLVVSGKPSVIVALSLKPF